MKRLIGLIIVAMIPASAWATGKTRVDIRTVTDGTAPSDCSVISWWGTDVLEVMRQQIEASLNTSRNVEVVEADRPVMYHPPADSNLKMIHQSGRYKNSEFSVQSSVRAFDLCARPFNEQSIVNARVAIDFVIFEVRTGLPVEKFFIQKVANDEGGRDIASLKSVPLGSGVFRDSTLGRALFSALTDASQMIVHHFPDAKEPDQDLKVKLSPHSPGT